MPLMGNDLYRGEYDNPPSRSSQANGRLAVVIIGMGFFILLSLSGVVWGLIEQPQENQVYQQYHSDPVCANTGYPTISCRVVAPMMVLDEWSEAHPGHSNSHCDWFIELRTEAGAEYTAEYETYNTGFGLPHFDAPLVYQVASVGATLNAEAWHDHVMWIYAGGRKHFTEDYPVKNGGYAFVGFCLFWTLLFMGILIAGVRNILRGG